MGGVIINIDINLSAEAYRTRLGFDRIGEFLDPCHQMGFIGELEGGEISAQQFFDKVRQYCRPGVTDDEITACQAEMLMDIDSYKVDYLRDLSKRFPLYMLSNNNPVVMPICKQIFADAGIPCEEIFQDLFLSYEMKLLKPGHEIYQESVRRTGLKAEELLFIDDSMANVEAARSVGINAAFYQRGSDLKALIESEIKKAE